MYGFKNVIFRYRLLKSTKIKSLLCIVLLVLKCVNQYRIHNHGLHFLKINYVDNVFVLPCHYIYVILIYRLLKSTELNTVLTYPVSFA